MTRAYATAPAASVLVLGGPEPAASAPPWVQPRSATALPYGTTLPPPLFTLTR